MRPATPARPTTLRPGRARREPVPQSPSPGRRTPGRACQWTPAREPSLSECSCLRSRTGFLMRGRRPGASERHSLTTGRANRSDHGRRAPRPVALPHLARSGRTHGSLSLRAHTGPVARCRPRSAWHRLPARSGRAGNSDIHGRVWPGRAGRLVRPRVRRLPRDDRSAARADDEIDPVPIAVE